MQLRIVSKNYTRASLRKISCFKKLYQGLSYNNFSCEQWRQESKVFCTVSVAKNLFKVTRRDWRRCFCFLCLFIFVNFEFVLIWHWSVHEPFLLRNRWSSFVIPGMVLRPKYCFSWGWIQDELRYFELKQDWSGPLTLHKRTNKLFYSLIFFRALTLMPKLRQALVEFEVSRNARTDYEFCIFVFKGI